MKTKSVLSSKEKLFCLHFVCNANAELSAKAAGYLKNPKLSACKLLSKDKIAQEIARLCDNRKKVFCSMALSCYEKIAFGNSADAISLLYMQSPTKEQLENMDLSMISEIKRPKDGAMEIKFFDRLKAIEKLSFIDMQEQSKNTSIIDAIAKGAQSLSSLGEDE